jgi:hypothetical protein
MLKLTRPIAFIDLETTGVNLSLDRIVEIAIVTLVIAITSCGSSRKYGCPGVAKNSTTNTIKA